MTDKQHAEAIFAWHLHIDTAFIRGMLAYGFRTMEEAVKGLEWSGIKTGAKHGARELVKYWTRLHQRFDKSFTEEMLLNPKRWAVFACSAEPGVSTTPTDLNDLLEIYEDWLWQLSHMFICDHNPKTPLFKELYRAYKWQVQCESSHYHMRIGLYDHDRLYREGTKLSADQLRTRVYISDLPTCFEDHPMYPQELLGRMNDKVIAANMKKTLADAKKKKPRK